MHQDSDISIREYRPEDARQVEECFVELQEFERTLEPARVPGKPIAARYLEFLLVECDRSDGIIFVAEADNCVVGFVCVLALVKPGEAERLMDSPREFAVVSDLVVLPEHRGRGLGRKLLSRAESFAGRRGASVVRLGVLARNEVARSFYRAGGWHESEIIMSKSLS